MFLTILMVLSMDEILRADESEFNDKIEPTLMTMKSVVEALESRSKQVQTPGIDNKPRSFGEASSITYKAWISEMSDYSKFAG